MKACTKPARVLKGAYADACAGKRSPQDDNTPSTRRQLLLKNHTFFSASVLHEAFGSSSLIAAFQRCAAFRGVEHACNAYANAHTRQPRTYAKIAEETKEGQRSDTYCTWHRALNHLSFKTCLPSIQETGGLRAKRKLQRPHWQSGRRTVRKRLAPWSYKGKTAFRPFLERNSAALNIPFCLTITPMGLSFLKGYPLLSRGVQGEPKGT